jgi:deoxycytidylate deaminase
MDPAPVDQDRRCWAWGAKCYNDEEKLKITQQVVKVLVDKKLLAPGDGNAAVEALRKSRISGLIEFTRAVHAEMEAMLSIARMGTNGLVGSTLHTTTYPCHNCAKHIVDAGIKRVVYLEPYEKSLARTLHPDAINDPLQERDSRKVSIDSYGGVSPRRFSDFFRPRSDRKDEGRFIDIDRNRHGIPPILREESQTIGVRIQTLQQWMHKDTHPPAAVKETAPVTGDAQV